MSNKCAIVAMTGRFPGCESVDELWTRLAAGEVCTTRFTPEELREHGIPDALISHQHYVPVCGFMSGVADFDANYFGFSAREAEALDPQLRWLLDTADACLQEAACDPKAFDGRVGVYVGVAPSRYVMEHVYANQELRNSLGEYHLAVLNDSPATLIAYKLGCTGPAVNVGTTCSTSLTAVHLACQSLGAYECDLALAGGARIQVPEKEGYFAGQSGILALDGKCRPFDAEATGTVPGNGVALLALMRLEDALEQKRPVLAVIAGSAINNDGSNKIGYTAPSEKGQAEVIIDAQEVAGVKPEQITYVEAHGTGTSLGDPIEIAALKGAFESGGVNEKHCAIGSVKGNLGHLDRAAGVTGVIKAVLAMRHGQLPANANFTQLNPELALDDSPFFVNGSLIPWEPQSGVRVAAISSFGIGGTNAHVIVEEAPAQELLQTRAGPQLLLLSAHCDEALSQQANQLAAHLECNHQVSLADATHTLLNGRPHLHRRAAVVAASRGEAIEELRRLASRLPVDSEVDKVGFVFPGQGAQHSGMAHALYRRCDGYRAAFDHCSDAVTELTGIDLRHVLGYEFDPLDLDQLHRTRLTQPAVFAVSYSLAQQLMAWGVEPACMIGHSLGEYVAACLAGVFTLEEAIQIVVKRAELMNQTPEGAMVAVAMSEEALRDELPEGLCIAAVNGKNACVISGAEREAAEFAEMMQQCGVPTQRLNTSHAFHSPSLRECAVEYEIFLEGYCLKPPTRPFVSNVTGVEITAEQAQDPRYWVRHMLETVRFSDGVGTLTAQAMRLVEVGPGNALSRLIGAECVPTLAKEVAEDLQWKAVLQCLGRLWQWRVPIPLSEITYDPTCRFVTLPTYPFRRQRYFVKCTSATETTPADVAADTRIYVDQWQAVRPVRPCTDGAVKYCLFVGQQEALMGALSERGWNCISVEAGAEFVRLGASKLSLVPTNRAHWKRLFGILRDEGRQPELIVFADTCDVEFADICQQLGNLLSAMGKESLAHLVLVTSGAFALGAGDELTLSPNSASCSALPLVIEQEFPAATCSQLDCDPGVTAPAFGMAIDALATEHDAHWTALRGQMFCVRRFQIQSAETQIRPITAGAYLVTGGIGHLGLALAQQLAKAGAKKIVLTTRQDPNSVTETAPLRGRLQSLRSLGADIEVARTDAVDEVGMRSLMANLVASHGSIAGIFHLAGDLSAHGFKPLVELDVEAFEVHTRTKLTAPAILERLAREFPVDHCVLVSSLSTVLGGLGFGAYAGASAAANAVASRASETESALWVSVALDGLSDDGGDSTLSLSAAAQVLIDAVSTNATVLYATRTLLPERLEAHRNAKQKILKSTDKSEREFSVSEGVEGDGSIGHEIGWIWRRQLGVSDILENDDYFMLGGHSLMATQMLTDVRERYGVEVPLDVFFSRPCLRELADYVEERLLASVDGQELERLLDEIGA